MDLVTSSDISYVCHRASISLKDAEDAYNTVCEVLRGKLPVTISVREGDHIQLTYQEKGFWRKMWIRVQRWLEILRG